MAQRWGLGLTAILSTIIFYASTAAGTPNSLNLDFFSPLTVSRPEVLPTWLELLLSLQFEFPAIEAPFVNGEAALNITDPGCAFGIEDISATFDPPNFLNYALKEMTVTCDASYLYLTATHNITGKVHFVMDNFSLAFTLNVSSSDTTPPLPAEASVSECSLAGMRLAEISFDDETGEVNDTFYALVVKRVQDEIPSMKCHKIVENVGPKVSTLMGLVAGLFSIVLPPPEPQPFPEINTTAPLHDWHEQQGLFKVVQALLANASSVINLIGEEIIGEDGRIEYTNDDWKPLIVWKAAELGIVSANITGLNTFSNFSLLQPILENNYSLGFDLSFAVLNISVELFLSTPIANITTTIGISLENVSLRGQGMVALYKDYWNMHKVHIRELSKECLLSSVYAFNVTFLDVEVASEIKLTNPNAPSTPILDLLNSVGELWSTTYGEGLRAVIRGLVGGPIRKLINHKFASANASISDCVSVPPVPSNFIDWRSNIMTKIFDRLFNQLDHHNKLPINSLIETLTREHLEGGIVTPLDFNLNFTLAKKNLTVVLQTHSLTIEGLNTFYDNNFWIPTSAYTLKSDLQFAFPYLNITLLTDLTVGDQVGTNVSFRISLQNITLDIGGRFKLDTGHFQNSRVNDTSNIHCVLQSVQELSVDELSGGVGVITAMYEWDGNWTVFTPKSLHSDMLSYYLKTIMNTYIRNASRSAPYRCKGEPVPPIEHKRSFLDGDFAHYFGGVAVMLAIGSSVFGMVWFVWGREKKIVDDEPEDLAVVTGAPKKQTGWNGAIWTSPRLPWGLKYLIPFIILLDIGLFAVANASQGASVTLRASVPGKDFKPYELFTFSLGNSIRDMWHAQVYALSILIAAFSGAWTYAKLLLMLVAWVLPPSKFLNSARRERMLIMLDSLGKWSMIDAYVLVMMIVAFRFHLPLGGAYLDIVVDAQNGFYAFVAAAIISLTLSHIILFIHRYVEQHDPTSLKAGGKLEALRVHSYRYEVDPTEIPKGSRGGSKFQQFRERLRTRPNTFGSCLQWTIVFVMLLTIVLIVVGSWIDAFQFHFEGAAGFVLGAGNDTSKFSLMSLGNDIPKTLPEGSKGAGFLQTTYFLFALVFPLLHLVGMLFIWTVPLTLKTQYWAFIACEVFNAWASLEVFISSVLASVLEIETFARFLIGSKCDLINPIIEKLLGQSQCFSVGASLSPGSWVLFGASLVSLIAGQIVMRNCHKALADRMAKEGYEHVAASMMKGSKASRAGSAGRGKGSREEPRLPVEEDDDDDQQKPQPKADDMSGYKKLRG